MEQTIEKISGSKLKVTIKLNNDESAKYEARALARLGTEHSFKGFRPSKAPSEVVRSKFGPEVVNHEAMLEAIREVYPTLVKEYGWETIGQPLTEVITPAPLGFTLEVTILPEVDLGKWESIKIERKSVTVGDQEVDNLISEIRDSRASEAAVDRPAQKGDKISIDFEILLDKVVVDGGKQLGYQVILGKNQLIPGFEDNIIGLTSGQEKTFNITFPQNYQVKLVGREAEVKLKLNQVWERTWPELDDNLAVSLGSFKTVAELRNKLNENLLDEHKEREEVRIEREMLEAMLRVATFSDLPEVLLEQELNFMVHELSHSVEERGLGWQDYLSHLKKDETALKSELKPQAVKRVKLALLIRAAAKLQKIEVDDSTIEAELASLLEHYAHDTKAVEYLQSEDYQTHLRSKLINQRTIELLKQKLVK